MLEQVAADASPSQAPCFVSTNSLRRMRKRAQTVVKDNWLPRDISMRTKGMALPVKGSNGTVATTRRGQKGSAAAAAANAGSSASAAAAANAGSSAARPSEAGALEALEALEAGEAAAAAGGAAAALTSHIKAAAADAKAGDALASTAAADPDARSHSPSGYSIKGAAHSRDTDNSKEADTRALDKTDTPRVYSSVSLDKTDTLGKAQSETAQMALPQEWEGTSAGGTGCDVPGDPCLATVGAEEEGGPAGAAHSPDAKDVQALS
jgi:hypothetical protein